MNKENQTPENEIETSENAFIETDVVAAEDSEILEEIGEENEEIAEEEIDPSEARVFGMPRMCFHGAAFGVACGYLLAGVIGLLFHKTVSATTCAVGCAVIGYLITNHFYKKQKKEKEALMESELIETIGE